MVNNNFKKPSSREGKVHKMDGQEFDKVEKTLKDEIKDPGTLYAAVASRLIFSDETANNGLFDSIDADNLDYSDRSISNTKIGTSLRFLTQDASPTKKAYEAFRAFAPGVDTTDDNAVLTTVVMRLQSLGYTKKYDETSKSMVENTFQTRADFMEAVIQFQKTNGLNPDAVIGGNTAEKLFGGEGSEFLKGEEVEKEEVIIETRDAVATTEIEVRNSLSKFSVDPVQLENTIPENAKTFEVEVDESKVSVSEDEKSGKRVPTVEELNKRNIDLKGDLEDQGSKITLDEEEERNNNDAEAMKKEFEKNATEPTEPEEIIPDEGDEFEDDYDFSKEKYVKKSWKERRAERKAIKAKEKEERFNRENELYEQEDLQEIEKSVGEDSDELINDKYYFDDTAPLANSIAELREYEKNDVDFNLIETYRLGVIDLAVKSGDISSILNIIDKNGNNILFDDVVRNGTTVIDYLVLKANKNNMSIFDLSGMNYVGLNHETAVNFIRSISKFNGRTFVIDLTSFENPEDFINKIGERGYGGKESNNSFIGKNLDITAKKFTEENFGRFAGMIGVTLTLRGGTLTRGMCEKINMFINNQRSYENKTTYNLDGKQIEFQKTGLFKLEGKSLPRFQFYMNYDISPDVQDYLAEKTGSIFRPLGEQ